MPLAAVLVEMIVQCLRALSLTLEIHFTYLNVYTYAVRTLVMTVYKGFRWDQRKRCTQPGNVLR